MDLLDGLILLFVALKLCKVIDWSWWLVLTPLWAWIALVAWDVVAKARERR